MAVNKNEKDKALEAAMAQIQKQFGKGAIMKLGEKGAQMNVEAISTGSISLDMASLPCSLGEMLLCLTALSSRFKEMFPHSFRAVQRHS